MFEYDAWLTKIVDGDTLHTGIDLGCDVATQQTVRLYGINCPEMGTAAGKAAKAYAGQWFSDHAPGGKYTLHTIKDHREKYGRYLGVIVAPDGANLNDDLILNGYAQIYVPTIVARGLRGYGFQSDGQLNDVVAVDTTPAHGALSN